MAAPQPRSDPDGAVDALADQVGVPVVPGVLLDQVEQDPAQRVLSPDRRSTPGDVEGRCGGLESRAIATSACQAAKASSGAASAAS